ncbi:alpha-L-rhamnosidase [Homoserinibacter sp. GY 40078]|uniref:alpha-L-rhamnosidase n=1 Tax=Homoserinibacter sp. GY 40078 TaxID=2603275 RepID=UPI0011CA355F|nr:alpha-L-rhamnosidase [Homoserinibacter sp. GY 40078]TXK18480.1 Bacterial alpha-L-rhamnosidase [Homoserinibacter sp. GY 40078]
MLTAYALSVEVEETSARGSLTRFAWRLRADEPAEDQGAMRIRIERVDGDRTPLVVDTGWRDDREVLFRETLPLESSSRYRVRLEVRGVDGRLGTGDETDFVTGYLDPSQWRAQWIGRDPEPGGAAAPVAAPRDFGRSWQTMYSPAPLQLRHSFQLDRLPVRAVLHCTARGIHLSYLNGERVGDRELAPGWTDYATRIESDSFDVTDRLVIGENVVAALVADGWWAGYVGFDTRRHAKLYGDAPQYLAQLELLMPDGSRRIVVSSEEWFERPGHVAMADLLMGEYHDVALETPGWTAPGFDSRDWRPVAVADTELGPVVPASGPPIRVIDRLAATSVTSVGETTVVDFGQNLVGRVRLTLKDQRPGALVRIRHGEMLDGESVYTANLRSAEATDAIALDDRGAAVFEPQLTIHGFRYVAIEGLTGRLDPEDIAAIVVGSDLPDTGTFACSSPLLNQLYENIRWGQRGNFVGIPTDCPQRDERLGWTADTQVFAPTALFNSDARSFLERWLVDLRSAQDADGAVPDVVPVPPGSAGLERGAPAWGDAAVLVPWAIYRATGDRRVLERSFDSMLRWNDYCHERALDGVWDRARGNDYGDWLSVDAETSKALVATAYLAHTTRIVAETAAIVGHTELAEQMTNRTEKVVRGFRAAFLSEDGLLEPTQTACLMTLAWRLAEADAAAQVERQLVADLEARGRRLTTGFLGVSLLCPVLADIGRLDLAYALLLQEEYPSWGYSIRHGATTIWERWDGWTEDRGFQTIAMNSFNHYSLGSVGEWLYRGVAGIDQAPGDAGFHDVILRPLIAPDLERAAASFEAPRGRISSSWRLDGEGYAVDVELPPGVRGRVELPGVSHDVGSGAYSFRVPLQAVLGGLR